MGSGAFGVVHQCANLVDGQEYAVKRIRHRAQPQSDSHLDDVLREVILPLPPLPSMTISGLIP